MAKYLDFYDSNKTYILPNGELCTPDMLVMRFPMLAYGKCVIGTNSEGSKFASVDMLVDLRDLYDLDVNLTDEEALAQLSIIANTVIIPEPTAEERIASALELQSMMAMPDVI